MISPALFNMYVADIPPPPQNITVVSYADDFTILTQGTDIPRLESAMTDYLALLADFFKARDLEISVPKSSSTLFTPATNEARFRPNVLLNDAVIPLNKTPKILGVVFDTIFSFAPHALATATKARQRTPSCESSRALIGAIRKKRCS